MTMTTTKTRLGALALGLALAAFASSASAQTALDQGQIMKSLQSAARVAPPDLSAALIRNAVQEHIQNNPGMPINWTPLQLLDGLAQINVQIQFALNSDIIRPESYATIGSIADALHHPILAGYKFVVTGNTDTTGDRQKRADAVMNALVTTYAVDPARLEAVGLGEENLQDVKNPQDPLNRRVQLINVGKYLPGR